MMSSIHEGSIGDTVKTISELIDLIKYGTGEAKKNRRYSAARLASDLVAVYPIILSKSVSKDSAVRIKKYIEAKEVQNLLLAIQATAISKATTGQEYLKNIHQNIDFASNGIEVPFEVIANMEGSYSSDLEVSYNELKSIMETMHRQENVKIYDTKLNPVSLNDFAITESAGSYNVRLEKITALTESEFDDLIAEIDDLESHGLHADANQLIASAHRYGKISAAEYKDAKMYASKKKAEYEISKKNSEKDRAEARRKEAEAMEILKKREIERDAEAKRSAIKNSAASLSAINAANAAVPTLLKVSFYNSQYPTIKYEYLIGVTAKLVPCNASEILRRIVNDNKDGKSFINILRTITGELKASELLFGIGRISEDLNSVKVKGSLGNTWQLLKNRATACKIASKTGFIKDYSPITTVIISREDADDLLKEENIDILDPKVASRFISSYNLTAIGILDDSVESLKIMFDDGSHSFNEEAYSLMEKESSNKEYKDLVKLIASSR